MEITRRSMLTGKTHTREVNATQQEMDRLRAILDALRQRLDQAPN